jgi:NADH dehydrogenase
LGAAIMEALLPKPPITTAALGLFDFPNTTTLDAVPQNFGFAPRSWQDYLAHEGVN